MLAYPLKPDVFDSHPLEMLIFWATYLHVFESTKWFGLEAYAIYFTCFSLLNFINFYFMTANTNLAFEK